MVIIENSIKMKTCQELLQAGFTKK